jgi:hypothetical protein
VNSMQERRAAVRAQLTALPEHELRVFVDILAIDVDAVELPLARFLADRALAGGIALRLAPDAAAVYDEILAATYADPDG